MIGELLKIAGQCDGVRCDMAMLVLPEVFERTWGIAAQPFWPKATAARARARPGLLLHGRGLLGPGMDAAAAGLRLRLRQAALRPPPRGARPAGARAFPRRAGLPGQAGPLPGEPRRAAGGGDVSARKSTRPRRSSPSCRPGLRFFHQGQFEGRTKRISPHLVPRRRTSRSTRSWRSSTTGCSAVLRQPAVRDGQWQLLECAPAWDGNWTCGLLPGLRLAGPGRASGCWSP